MLGALATQLTIAREHALLGDYNSSQVYFDGVLSQISRYGNDWMLPQCSTVVTVYTNSLPCRHLQHMDDAFTRSKWQACRRALQAEQDLVKNISKEIAGLEGPSAVAAPAQVSCAP